MALTYGFYDSINGDRTYSSEDFSHMFDGVITDGVFDSIGNMFAVVPNGGMKIVVKSGKGWFNRTWNVNDNDYLLTVTAPDVTLSRIDAVVIEVNRSQSVRANSFKIVKGVAATNPARPSLTKSDEVNQWALAYITVRGGTSEIKASDITNVVGMSETPFVTGVVQTASIDSLYAQWNAEFHEAFGEWQDEFEDWFADLQAQLEGNVVTNLQNQINALNTSKVNVTDKATVAEAQAGTNDTKWMSPSKTKDLLLANKATVAEAKAGTNDTKWLSPLLVKQSIDANSVKVGDIVWGLSAPIGKGTFVECNDTELINPADVISTKLACAYENGVYSSFTIIDSVYSGFYGKGTIGSNEYIISVAVATPPAGTGNRYPFIQITDSNGEVVKKSSSYSDVGQCGNGLTGDIISDNGVAIVCVSRLASRNEGNRVVIFQIDSSKNITYKNADFNMSNTIFSDAGAIRLIGIVKNGSTYYIYILDLTLTPSVIRIYASNTIGGFSASTPYSTVSLPSDIDITYFQFAYMYHDGNRSFIALGKRNDGTYSNWKIYISEIINGQLSTFVEFNFGKNWLYDSMVIENGTVYLISYYNNNIDIYEGPVGSAPKFKSQFTIDSTSYKHGILYRACFKDLRMFAQVSDTICLRRINGVYYMEEFNNEIPSYASTVSSDTTSWHNPDIIDGKTYSRYSFTTVISPLNCVKKLGTIDEHAYLKIAD